MFSPTFSRYIHLAIDLLPAWTIEPKGISIIRIKMKRIKSIRIIRRIRRITIKRIRIVRRMRRIRRRDTMIRRKKNKKVKNMKNDKRQKKVTLTHKMFVQMLLKFSAALFTIAIP